MDKKVLIVTYYWPPAGGPGVQRWLKFTRYLPDFDIHPVVYTPQNPSYPLLDHRLENQVSKELTVIKQLIWEPYKWADYVTKKNKAHRAGFYEKPKKQSWKTKCSLFIRGNFFIPDARKFWVRPSVQFLKKYLIKEEIDTIITTGPPHSIHLIGLGLKKSFPKLKWIVDFRDPWTNIYYYPSLKLTRWANRKHHQLEQKVLTSADRVITVTREYQALYQKNTPTPVHCLTNGFDPLDYSSSFSTDTLFSIVYIGTMFKERNPKILWEVLQELSKENTHFAKDLSIRLIGKIDATVLQNIRFCQLENSLDLQDYLPHEDAIKAGQSARVLLLVTANQSGRKGNIPGKLFEYLGAGRPIVAFGPPESEIEKILKETDAGTYFLFDDRDTLKKHLLLLYKQYKSGTLKTHSKGIAQYERKNITEKLSEIIKE